MLQTKEIPLDSISLSEQFKRDTYDPSKYNDLLTSIKQVGIMYPLITIETDQGLLLISGYRRFQAAKEAGLASAPCYVLKIGIDDAEIMRLHENLFREDISPLQEAVAFARLEQTYHFTRDKISKLIGKSKSYVTQRLQILDWPLDLQQALGTGQISYSIARELSVVTDPTELKSLLSTCITSGATVRTVIQWVQDWKTSSSISSSPTSPPPLIPSDTSSSSSSSSCYFCTSDYPTSSLSSILVCKDCLDIIINSLSSPTTPDPSTNHTPNPQQPNTQPTQPPNTPNPNTKP